MNIQLSHLSVAADNNKDVRSTKDPVVNGVCESNNLVNGSCNGTEEVEKGETEASEKGGDKKDEPEVVFIQDMGFTVKIVSPGTEAFDIQVLEEINSYLNPILFHPYIQR